MQHLMQGTMLTPADIGYDAARKSWNLSYNLHPALIVMAHSTADIVQAVSYARDNHMTIGVMASGHGPSVLDGNTLLINTSQMTDVRIDAETCTAWIEAGAKWGKVLEAAQAVGLAPLLGSSPDVGAVGYTLGGGMGWLARKYGLAADSALSFELVTADGQLLRANAMENPELFWALRGGSGSFGVVTSMEVQLYPVTTVYGGNLIYPAEAAREVYTHYREWIAAVPDDLTSSISLMNFPPLPQIPEFLRGQTVIMVRGCYSGPVEEGEKLLNQWRAWKTPMADHFGPMPFSQVAAISQDPTDPMPSHVTGLWLKDLSDPVIDILLEHAITHNGLVASEIRHVGGAVARARHGASAYSHRDATLIFQMVSLTPTPEAWLGLKQYTEMIKQKLAPYATGGVYANFLEGQDKVNLARSAFTPEVYQRLSEIKAQYDPENMFRFGLNIIPAHS